MFNCFHRHRTERDIIQNVEACEYHGQPYVFVCLNQDPQCAKEPLLCLKCLESHKGHDWESTQKFFSADFKEALEKGISVNGEKLERINHSISSQFQRLRVKVNRKVDELQHDFKTQMEHLTKLYPLKSKFGIKGHSFGNHNAPEIIKIAQRQKKTQWPGAMQRYYIALINEVSNMISNLFIDFESYIDDVQWQDLTMDQTEEDIQQFIKKYEGVINNEKHYFRFSEHFKNEGIRINDEGLQAKFVKSRPSKPAILTEKNINNQHNTIYFKMNKMESKMMVFEATLVAVGVCLQRAAKAYGYRNLIEPSHGAYLMGSNGRCYHSSLVQYQKKDLGFSFSQGDIVAVSVDFKQKTVNFSMKAFFKKQFKMELMLKDEQMQNLKPCLLFHGEEGAIVEIVEEEELRNKKKKKK